tara:strand:+ start:111 stop:218 length:108 start_codon:yes stop_codon:yes gene_type:complete
MNSKEMEKKINGGWTIKEIIEAMEEIRKRPWNKKK